MTTQTEALRLADGLEQTDQMYPNADVSSVEVATELRRLHDRIKDLESDVEFLSQPAQQDELAREAGCNAAADEGHRLGVKSTDSLRIVAAYLNAAHGITKGNT